MEKAILRRICDNCKAERDFDQNNLRPEDEKAMMEWIVLGRQVIVNGQAASLVKHGCSGVCAKALLEKGAMDIILPPQQERRGIDLASLKKGVN